MRSARRWLVVILSSGVAVLALAGVLSLIAFFVLSRQQQSALPGWSDPTEAIVPDEIVAELAVQQLQGTADIDILTQALEKDELETAYAVLVYSTSLTDREKGGSWLLLANRYIEANDRVKAQLCYQQAGTLATLSPDLSDFTRADTYVQIGQGLARLGERGAAKFNYDQAHIVALHSPFLKKRHRRHFLDLLAEAYKDLGETDLAKQCLEQSANLEPISLGTEEPTREEEEPLLGSLGEMPPVPQDVVEAEATRREAAQRLVARLKIGTAREPTAFVENVGRALQAEDEARQTFYRQQRLQSSSLAGKIALTQAQIEWLTLKYRIARRGYGLSLVPDWEQQLPDIQINLSKAYEDLYSLLGEQVVALPEAKQIDRGWVEVSKRWIEAGRLGLYPNYPESQFVDDLREATLQVIAAQPGESLRVDAVPRQDGGYDFILVPDELYS